MQPEGSKRTDGTGPLLRLAAPPAVFKGREAELSGLLATLQSQRVKMVGLFGADGVGKTALALALADGLAEHYSDAQFLIVPWGTAQPGSATAVMRQVIWTLQPLARPPEDEPGIAAAFADVLRGRRTLLLVDNTSSSEALADLLPGEGCLVILTSRERLIAPRLHGQTLSPLAQVDAEALLLEAAPRIGKLAAELAELAGGLPLALQLVGSTLEALPGLDPADYADRLLAEQWELSELDEARAALALSYKLLGADLQRCWRQLAVFPGDFGRLAAGTVWALEPNRADQALAELTRHGLLAYDGRSRRFRLHDLARRAASARLEVGEAEEVHRHHAVHYLRILEGASLLYQRGGENRVRGLRLFDLEQANVIAAQAWAEARAANDQQAAKLVSEFPTLGASILAERLSNQERMAWLQAAGRAARRLGNRGVEGQMLSKLGSVYRRQSEPRWAIDYYERQLRLAREAGDRQGEGAALGNLGLAYAEMGNTRRAVAYYEQHLELAREMGDRRAEARTSWNLGLALEELGDLAQAIAAMQICLDFEREVGHPDAEADGAVVERLRLRLAGGSDGQPGQIGP